MKRLTNLLFLLAAAAISSCTKVIDVNLNSAAPKYVITGDVTDGAGPYTVNITKTVNFNQDNTFPGVSDATVYITDVTAGSTDTLAPAGAGRYQSHTLAGVPGHTYRLTVVAAGETFAASSTMPQPIGMDSLYLEKSLFGDNLNVVPVYTDPAGTGNYYHIVLTVHDSISAEAVYLHDDEVVDGQVVRQPLRNSIKIDTGDSVLAELQCVDHNVFQYYRNLQGTIAQNSASPANPQSNITGGALGYFSAHTVSKRGVVAR